MAFIEIFKTDPEQGNIEVIPQQCDTCEWKIVGTTRCLAFPKDIPVPILLGVYDHNAHYADETHDDMGTTYLQRTGPVKLVAKTEPRLTFKSNVIPSPHAGSLAHIFKANPNHDEKGQFAHVDAGWSKVSGQKGSNPGGVFKKNGQKYYVKYPRAKGQIYAEQAADKVYELMGVETMNHQAVKVNGKTASVSKWKEVAILGESGWRKLNDVQVQDAANAFVASALTKNWDVAGLSYDNMGTTKEGRLAILDTGGSFKYRAQGEPKPYDSDPTPELEGMQSPKKTSGRVFGPLVKEHKDAFTKAAEKLKSIPDEKLSELAGTMRDKEMPRTIIDRKNAILKYFEVA